MAESTVLREEAPVVSMSADANNSSVEDATSSSSTRLSLEEKDLKQLARQVEYYLSTANLAKDTYVATLRSLNDGYVPLSILANFGKVRAIARLDGVEAVRKAATDHSNLLEVVRINTNTGKRASKEEEALSTTLEAVGPIGGEPIQLAETAIAPQSPVAAPSPPSVQNIVILREVPADVAEEQVRELFSFETCPSIKSLHLDVANCWFVTLDTASRDDVVNVMFELRTKTYASGERVQARLKSAAVLSNDAPANIQGMTGPLYIPQSRSGGRKNKKKKNSPKNPTSPTVNSRGKANNTTRRNNNAGGNKNKSVEKSQPQKLNYNNATAVKRLQQTPPPLGEEAFPSLQTEDESNTGGNKVVEKVPEDRPDDEFEKNRAANSDSASTATTSTSSSACKQTNQAMGGYAAALLKAPKSQPAVETKEQQLPHKEIKKSAGRKAKETQQNLKQTQQQVNQEKRNEKLTPVVVSPPSWGGGRSFADVLKKEQAMLASAQQLA